MHPKFKLNWLSGEKKKLAESYLEDPLEVRSTENSPVTEKSDDHDDFFIFKQRKTKNQNESGGEGTTTIFKIEELTNNIEMLHNYSKIKKLFITYSTPLPSSASVEHMFSVDGLVLTPHRKHVNDDTMEQHILLKINKDFCIS